MMRVQSDSISLYDLWIAYRKTKADLYYADGHPNAVAICEYEENLEKNLSTLYDKLNKGSWGWMSDQALVGTWSLIPKGNPQFNRPEESERASMPRCIISDPDVSLDRFIKQGASLKVEFRQIGVHPIDYHVVTTLWMLKVGCKYDALLGEEVYGSRLRRKKPDEGKVL